MSDGGAVSLSPHSLVIFIYLEMLLFRRCPTLVRWGREMKWDYVKVMLMS